MRRGALLAFWRPLRAFGGAGAGGSLAAEATVAAACTSTLLASTDAAGGSAAAALAAAWRPFSAAAAAAAEAGAEAKVQRVASGSRRKTRPIVQNAPPEVLRLMECEGVDAMREWRLGVQSEGRFTADMLSAAIRVLGMKAGIPPQQRQDYLRELLAAATSGSVELDGKAAAYLLWGPAKCGMRRDDPDVQRVLPAVFAHIDTMQSNDLTTCLWACGLMGVPLSDDVKQQVAERLIPMLPSMKVKELTAAGVGITRLGLPASFAEPLVQAFEAKLGEAPDLHPGELERIVKLMPFLPGVEASSPMAREVFQQLVAKAHRAGLAALAEAVWAAGRMQYHFEDEDLQRLLSCAERKLGASTGVEVQSLLHGLGAMGLTAGEGPVSHSFLERCAEAQVELSCRGASAGGAAGKRAVGHILKLLHAFSLLRAHVPAEHLQRLLDGLEQGGMEHIEKPWRVQMDFRRLKFNPGVEALEPLTNHGEQLSQLQRQRRMQSRAQREGQQEQQEQQAGDDEQV